MAECVLPVLAQDSQVVVKGWTCAPSSSLKSTFPNRYSHDASTLLSKNTVVHSVDCVTVRVHRTT